jgi:S1-C subfamily serine protease
MKKAPLYSRSRRPASPDSTLADTGSSSATDATASATAAAAPPPAASTSRWRRLGAAPVAWGVAGLASGLALALAFSGGPHLRPLTQKDIDRAVRESLENEPLPSQAAKAYAAISPSVVRVIGLMDDSDEADKDTEQKAMDRSLGTGVVIIDNGTILTNLHVVAGAKRIKLRFWNGEESEAHMVGAQPKDDLAVLKASKVPDDLQAATMRSTADLNPGDHVIAVGHPFGIGPSVSYGVVSGLKREFRSPEGERTLSNLIQFDAAANPGNSGGPLVTMDGHVVGIVTAILNPSEQRTFIGIGFAVPIENAASAAGMPPF